MQSILSLGSNSSKTKEKKRGVGFADVVATSLNSPTAPSPQFSNSVSGGNSASTSSKAYGHNRKNSTNNAENWSELEGQEEDIDVTRSTQNTDTAIVVGSISAQNNEILPNIAALETDKEFSRSDIAKPVIDEPANGLGSRGETTAADAHKQNSAKEDEGSIDITQERSAIVPSSSPAASEEQLVHIEITARRPFEDKKPSDKPRRRSSVFGAQTLASVNDAVVAVESSTIDSVPAATVTATPEVDTNVDGTLARKIRESHDTAPSKFMHVMLGYNEIDDYEPDYSLQKYTDRSLDPKVREQLKKEALERMRIVKERVDRYREQELAKQMAEEEVAKIKSLKNMTVKPIAGRIEGGRASVKLLRREQTHVNLDFELQRRSYLLLAEEELRNRRGKAKGMAFSSLKAGLRKMDINEMLFKRGLTATKLEKTGLTYESDLVELQKVIENIKVQEMSDLELTSYIHCEKERRGEGKGFRQKIVDSSSDAFDGSVFHAAAKSSSFSRASRFDMSVSVEPNTEDAEEHHGKLHIDTVTLEETGDHLSSLPSSPEKGRKTSMVMPYPLTKEVSISALTLDQIQSEELIERRYRWAKKTKSQERMLVESIHQAVTSINKLSSQIKLSMRSSNRIQPLHDHSSANSAKGQESIVSLAEEEAPRFVEHVKQAKRQSHNKGGQSLASNFVSYKIVNIPIEDDACTTLDGSSIISNEKVSLLPRDEASNSGIFYSEATNETVSSGKPVFTIFRSRGKQPLTWSDQFLVNGPVSDDFNENSLFVWGIDADEVSSTGKLVNLYRPWSRERCPDPRLDIEESFRKMTSANFNSLDNMSQLSSSIELERSNSVKMPRSRRASTADSYLQENSSQFSVRKKRAPLKINLVKMK